MRFEDMKTVKIKEGKMDDFKRDLALAVQNKPIFDVSTMTRLFEELGFSKMVGLPKKKRLRKKRLKQLIAEHYEDVKAHNIRSVFRHCEGFDENGYWIQQ